MWGQDSLSDSQPRVFAIFSAFTEKTQKIVEFSQYFLHNIALNHEHIYSFVKVGQQSNKNTNTQTILRSLL